MNLRKLALFYLVFSVLTLLLMLPDMVFFFKNSVYNYAISGFFIVQALLMIPVVIFARKLKIYYWIAAIIASLLPLMLMPVFYMNIQVNAEMVGLLLDTNMSEVYELLGWKIILVFLSMIFTAWLFLKLAKKLPSQITWKQAAIVSLIGLLAFGAIPLVRSQKIEHYKVIARNTFRTYYPFRVANVMTVISSEMQNMKKYKETTANFNFGATRKNISDTTRQIYVLVIGEASRPDHWGINGYERNTSPKLQQLSNLVSFKDVASGGSMTIISVPQIITRAEANTYSQHKTEKSILKAFKEAGYYSAWISNQSQYGLTGNIGMHFNDGDTAIFCGHGENEGNFTGAFDIGVIDKMRNLIDTQKGDLFMIVHLIGSHWRYNLRYPETFAKFQPTSDRNRSLLTRPPKEKIINEYDNSILYSDYILDSITKVINATGATGSMLFVSDHGENLGDDDKELYFHSFRPVKYTARVPLFIWMSDAYAKQYPAIKQNLIGNEQRKISSAVSVFYTMTDLAGINIPGADSTKSVAGKNFKEGPRLLVDEKGTIYNFNDL